MIIPNKYWIAANSLITDIINPADVITFAWSGNHSDDYIKLSESFYQAAYYTIIEIIDNCNDNSMCDQWFFPALYLYRQAIELLCKGLLISVIPRKNITSKLTTNKHNILSLFTEYIKVVSNTVLNSGELIWVQSYLSDLEAIDQGSNLFRYPIKDGYLNQFNDDFLDIAEMANTIDQCYSIIHRCVDAKHDPQRFATNIDLSLTPTALVFAAHGIGNCMLYTSPWDDGFYPQVQGFSNIAYFLLDKLPKDHWSFLPIAYLNRHAIELVLKRILLSRTSVNVCMQQQHHKRKSHCLYQDLWVSVKGMVTHYARANSYDLSMISIADAYIKDLSALDKKGDRFRYPTDYGLQYHLQLTQVDYYHAVHWLISIFNFLAGCSDMLEAVYDCECEMKSYQS